MLSSRIIEFTSPKNTHNPAGADKSEGESGGLWVVDWPEKLLPMWLETLREQLRLHLHFLYFSFLRHGDSAEHKEFLLLSMLCFPNGGVCSVRQGNTEKSTGDACQCFKKKLAKLVSSLRSCRTYAKLNVQGSHSFAEQSSSTKCAIIAAEQSSST